MANITEKSLKDVLEVRQALEQLAIRLACARITEEEKQLLKKRLQDCERVMRTGDTSAIAKADVAFHDTIVVASGNDRLVQLVNNLSEQMYRYRFEYIKDVSKHSQIIREHSQMYEYIVHNQGEQATDVVRIHIENQERAVMDLIQREQNTAGK